MMNNYRESHLLHEEQPQFEYGQLPTYPVTLSIGDGLELPPLFEVSRNCSTQVVHLEVEPESQTSGRPLLREEASPTTVAKPDFRTDDANLVKLTPNKKTLKYSPLLDKYFAQRGGPFEITIHHGILKLEEFFRLFVNYTQERLIKAVAKICEDKRHRAYQKPNIDFVLTIDEPQAQGLKIEYIKDPNTGKLSAKVYPVPGTQTTTLTVRFNCVNGCKDRKQDKQWKLVVTKESGYSGNLMVISRASIDIKAAEKHISELKREEQMKVNKDMNLTPGRGRKRKAETEAEELITLMVGDPSNIEGSQILESVPFESTCSFQPANTSQIVGSGSSGEVGFQLIDDFEQNTLIILNENGMNQTNSLEVVVPEPSGSYTMIVDSNTPRDVLENKFVNLKTHLSNEELILLINTKTPKEQ